MDSWEGIDEFVAVARTGSFIAGAQSLGVSRTHMSRAIARLEDSLNARLLHRTTRTVNLTPTGRIFLDHCSRLLNDRDEAMALVREQGEPRGELRITCSTALGERFVAPLARRFAVQHPQLTLFLDLSNRLVDLVGEGYDLAIRTGSLFSSNLIATRIGSRQFHTCASPTYLDRRGKPHAIDDLDRHDCLIGSSPAWHFSVDGAERIYRPKGSWSCNNGQTVLDAAMEGMGICHLPQSYVAPALEAGQLVPLLGENAPPTEPIWAVYPDRRHLSPKVQRFVALLKTELPRILPGGVS
ncbi:LysR family transcriptional regulator [Novosphingobium cyanobacteriorum]|uniref:LysR family transcriptional regulator n=1 Tax=Novosphingobium cyanobacteriorum TaxID=3024215 RepID=A0ABT6CQQ7_9SPHN|nr:LysR family transcriptional regulator [Novosphingobium cyanobacteriorum]MDF8335914.1 LysR family transcriptional regulator [Novosphingobium cyanobacteriorum]